jgi:D-beta-D-heptose 7-phosphate kinase/D-beta-D-heptose 1-phosphate adenosyltransferase
MMTSLSAALQQVGQPALLATGDILLDRTTWGNAERISPEAPVLVLRADRREAHAGGAGSVATMLRALDARVQAVGAVGDDEAGQEVERCLAEAGVHAGGVCVVLGRTTPRAERLIGRAAQRHAHQILRVDDGCAAPLPEETQARLLDTAVAAIPQCQALVISDYGYGACSPRLLRTAIDAGRQHGCPVLIDPGENADYAHYRGAALVTPNRRQAQAASGIEIRQPKDALLAGCSLCDRFGLEAVAIKLDRDGLALITTDGQEHLFPTRARSVYDVTGARDMVLAVFGLCLAGRMPLEQAAPLANLAAGLKLERLGAAGVGRDELQAEVAGQEPTVAGKLTTLDQMTRLAEAYRHQGRKIVFTNGCFDLLHVGHVTYLQQAAAMGDVLVVAINSDASVRTLKGPQRPIYDQHVRASMLGALDCVDHLLIFDDATPHALLWALRPDVLVKGGTYTPDQVVGREVVLAYGGRVCVAGMVGGVSTTAIVSSVRKGA